MSDGYAFLDSREAAVIHGFWFTPISNKLGPGQGDVMQVVIEGFDGKFYSKARYRLYYDNKVWGSRDVKRFFSLGFDTVDQAVEHAQTGAKQLEAAWGIGEADYIDFHGPLEDFTKILLTKPYASAKEASPEELEEFKRTEEKAKKKAN